LKISVPGGCGHGIETISFGGYFFFFAALF